MSKIKNKTYTQKLDSYLEYSKKFLFSVWFIITGVLCFGMVMFGYYTMDTIGIYKSNDISFCSVSVQFNFTVRMLLTALGKSNKHFFFSIFFLFFFFFFWKLWLKKNKHTATKKQAIDVLQPSKKTKI